MRFFAIHSLSLKPRLKLSQINRRAIYPAGKDTDGEQIYRPVRSVKKAFHTAREAAGLGQDVIPYTIRHTVATELRKRGVSKWELEAFLAHTDTSTTDQYAKYDSEYLRRSVAAIDQYFEELRVHTRRHVRDMTGVVALKKQRL